MAGIYIHIPFCRKACTYCNFHFSTTLREKLEVIRAIEKEIAMFPPFDGENRLVDTIYFGGGTPGMLEHDELQLLMDALQVYPRTAQPEITIEINPDDVHENNLAFWHSLGINRLSIGVQSFSDVELKWMNRSHDAAQSYLALKKIADSPIQNWSADLIYGSHLLTDDALINHLETLIQLGAKHISCYALTVEQSTALAHRILKNPEENPDPEKQARHFSIVRNILQEAGYEHYEISNFALPGFRSRHNSNYWKGIPYTGYGPSAHSYNGARIRKWNVANNITYKNNIVNQLPVFTEEILTPTQQLNEYIMVTLRTIEGISLQHIRESFGEAVAEALLKRAVPIATRQLLQIQNDTLQLTDAGKFLADGITADLFAD